MTDSGRRRGPARGLVVGVLAGGLAAVVGTLVAGCSPDDGAERTTDQAPTSTTTPAELLPRPEQTAGPTTTTDQPATTITPTTTQTTTTPATPTTGPAPASGTAFAAIDPIVTAHIAARGLNGAGLVIVERDRGVIHEDYWGEFGPDRISLVASSSKMIVGGVLLALDDRGALDLDEPVADVVDWGAANPDITPAQLVSNSSGLVGLAGGFTLPPYLCQFVAVGALQDCAAQVFTTDADDGRVIPPDTEFRYGGAQWQVAGAVAEVAAGQSWNDLVADTYRACEVASLGFNNQWTQFGILDFDYPDRFGADPDTLAPTDNPNIEGGAYISPTDYAELLLMLVRDGRCGDQQVLSPESVDRMLADRIGDVYGGSDDGNANLGYGIGWFVDRESGRRLDPGAYGSVAWIDPAAGYAAYLVVESGGDDGNDLAERLFDVVETAVLEARNTDGG